MKGAIGGVGAGAAEVKSLNNDLMSGRIRIGRCLMATMPGVSGICITANNRYGSRWQPCNSSLKVVPPSLGSAAGAAEVGA